MVSQGSKSGGLGCLDMFMSRALLLLLHWWRRRRDAAAVDGDQPFDAASCTCLHIQLRWSHRLPQVPFE
jgi:hypothetical protein